MNIVCDVSGCMLKNEYAILDAAYVSVYYRVNGVPTHIYIRTIFGKHTYSNFVINISTKIVNYYLHLSHLTGSLLHDNE